MEHNFGDIEEELNLTLAKMEGAIEFVIPLISRHAYMILVECRAHNKLLTQRLGLLEIKMHRLQLANEMLEF